MFVRYLYDTVNVQRIFPDSVLSHPVTHRRSESLVSKGDALALLREAVVVIHILQCIDAVFAVCHTLYREVSVTISTRYT